MTERQRALIDDLNLIENPQERLSILVERSRHLPSLPPEDRTKHNLVPGCVSQVWLLCSRDTAGRCHFRCDADGPLVKALVTLLCDYYSDCTPAEILAPIAPKETENTAPDGRPMSRPQNKRVEDSETDSPLAALGLLQSLSPTRKNGLAQVRARIHAFARAQVSSHA